MKTRFFTTIAVFIFIFASCNTEYLTNDDLTQIQSYADAKIGTALSDMPSEIITLQSGVIVEKIGEYYIIDGDVILTDWQLRLLDETGILFNNVDINEPVDMTNAIQMPAKTGMMYYFPNHISTRAASIYPTSLPRDYIAWHYKIYNQKYGFYAVYLQL